MKLKNIKITKKTIIIFCIILFLIIFVVSLFVNSKQEQKEQEEIQRIKSYTSMDNFKSIKEVAKYLDCEFIKQETSKDENYYLDIYMKIKRYPYENGKSYKPYYQNLASYCVHTIGYKNVRIIDESKQLVVSVICDEDRDYITGIYINGDDSYFEKQESNNIVHNLQEVKTTDFETESEILKKLINSDWICTDADFGTVESNFENYKIFFDEGIEVRKVGGKIFNIIFTSKYNSNIVNGINTSCGKEKIIEILGKPTFEEDIMKLIGYKGKDFYLFYNEIDKQISIYPVLQNYETKEFAKIIDNYKKDGSLNNFINSIKQEWNDYDVYTLTDTTAVIQYTLKGVLISFNYEYGNGVTVYNNYNGYVSEDTTMLNVINGGKELPDKVFVKNENLVYKTEVNRLYDIDYMKMYGNFNGPEETNETQEYESTKFLEFKKGSYNDEETYISKIISINNEYPNSEIKEYINSSTWIDDYNLVYSVKNKGIYIYNAQTRTYKTLITGKNEEFNIVKYENGILQYDEKSIKIEL